MSNNTAATAALVLSADDATARDLIRHERSTAKIRYAKYITEHNVTLDDVPAHVQALANLAGDVKPWATPAERKAFCTKIRNGLKHHLTPAVEPEEDSEEEADESTQDAPKNLLTRAGLAASLEDVVAAWKAANEASEAVES